MCVISATHECGGCPGKLADMTKYIVIDLFDRAEQLDGPGSWAVLAEYHRALSVWGELVREIDR